MDAKFINPVLNSMVNVLATMAQIDSEPGKPVLKTDDEARGAVTGLIALQGAQVRGSMAISFPQAVIADIVQRMLGEEITEVDETARDLTGEITNMVLGGAKNLFEQQGYDFGLSLPNVLVGVKHVVEHPYPGPKILLPFQTGAGEFYVEICFEA